MTKYVFMVGCPRSGTTWLQLLLLQHPEVSSCMETHLFKYLAPMVEKWNHYRHDRVGLQSVLSDEEFKELLRDVAMNVLHRIGTGRVILEKTPDHVWFADLILRLIPEAWFIHLIRDPRSVASSLTSAGRSWGSHWASPDVADNARCWVAAVSAGRQISQMTSRYLELRYEEFLGDGVAHLDGVFQWLELQSDADLCRRAIDACTLDKLKARAVPAPWPAHIQPEGFYRKGSACSWREDLPKADIDLVEEVAGPLMKELGYRLSSA
jgi:hypothetical protein